MQNRANADRFKQYPYDYTYAYKRPIPSYSPQYSKTVKKHARPKPRIIKEVEFENSRTEIYYNYGADRNATTNAKSTQHDDEISQGGTYEQPTLPYYVVPVLYVPKRVLPNEPIQQASTFRARQPPTSTKTQTQKRYSTNVYENADREYEQFRNIYQQFYGPHTENEFINGDTDVEQGIDDSSYYNMQYSVSSSTMKDEEHSIPVYSCKEYMEPMYNFHAMEKPKLHRGPSIRPLKPQPGCQEFEHPKAKMRLKNRRSHELLQRKQYYFDDDKQIVGEEMLRPPQKRDVYYDTDLAFENIQRQLHFDNLEERKFGDTSGDFYQEYINANNVQFRAMFNNDIKTLREVETQSDSTSMKVSPESSILVVETKPPPPEPPEIVKDTKHIVKFVECATGQSECIITPPLVKTEAKDSYVMTEQDVIVKPKVTASAKKTQTAHKTNICAYTQTEPDIAALLSDLIADAADISESPDTNEKQSILKKLKIPKEASPPAFYLPSYTDVVKKSREPSYTDNTAMREYQIMDHVMQRDMSAYGIQKIEHAHRGEAARRVSTTVKKKSSTIPSSHSINADLQARQRHLKSESPTRRIRKY